MAPRKVVKIFCFVAGAVLTGEASAAQVAQAHHDHHHELATDPVQGTAPALEILMPGNDDVVGRQLGVVVQTPTDLSAATMSAAKVGVHLHIELEGLVLMPTRQQLVDLGRNRYVFLFDLPANPGRNTVKVYWADAKHRTIESSIRSVTVSVRP